MMKSLALCVLLLAFAILASCRQTHKSDSISTWLSNMEKAFEEANHELAKQDRETESLEKDDDLESFWSASFPSTGFFNTFLNNGISPPWWKGNNVCTSKTEDLSPFPGGSFWTTSLQTQSCYDDADSYVCITKSTTEDGKSIRSVNVTRQCCHGYRRGRKGCYQVNLKTVMKMLEQLGTTEYMMEIQEQDLDKQMSENITVFAYVNSNVELNTLSSVDSEDPEILSPTTTAPSRDIESFETDADNELTVPANRKRRDIQPSYYTKVNYFEKQRRHRRDLQRVARQTDNTSTIRSSIVSGFHKLSGTIDEKALITNDDSIIRLNLFRGPNGSRRYTANCVVITEPNIEASNGFIHLLEKPIIKANRLLSEILEQEPRYSRFVNLIKNTEFWAQISDSNGKPLTVIVPTNDAFERLPKEQLEAWEKGESCAKDVIGNHILSFTLCSAAVWSSATVRTESNHILPLSPDSENPNILLTMNNGRLSKLDNGCVNGVIHESDTVLIPSSARSLREALSASNKEWLKIMDEVAFDFPEDNVTILALTDEALEKPESIKVLEEARSTPDGLRALVMAHTATSSNDNNNTECDGYDGLTSPTWLEPLIPASRPKLFVSSAPAPFRSSHPPSIQCKPIAGVVTLCDGNRIIQMQNLLISPKKSLLELVTGDPNLSMFAELIKKSEKWSNKLRSTENDGVTLLAPVDSAWKEIGDNDASEFSEKLIDSIIGAHILKEPVCCESAPSWPFTGRAETIDGDWLGFRRDINNQVSIEKANLEQCNRQANNGIMHVIDTVLIPRLHQRLGGWLFDGQSRGSPGNVDTMLFGI